ncbi:MAG: M43 family zinc metalloprotease, partial [Saprospiraceae bacterium]
MKHACLFFSLLIALHVQAQGVFSACGTDAGHAQMLKADPALAAAEQAREAAYREAVGAAQKGAGGVLVLPVVVHIVHDGGAENISDAQVLKGIEYLNDAYRNRNYYNPATGADTEVEFCLARRGPAGNAFSGIVRHQSPLTDMSAPAAGNLFDLCAWDTKNYIRIILVREVCVAGSCAVAGFANSAGHGGPYDGIVLEARYFGTTPREGVVLAHEMGHYLGLLHTFQGGCENDNCLTDGDRVCDTPPDNSVAPLPCGGAYNSCHTDADDPLPQNPFRSPALGGLGDQDDMHRNYMDYSPYECYDRFTEGQKVRMRFFIETLRAPLLASKACLPPCPQPVTALFAASADSVEAGGQVAVQNLSQHAAGYQWLVNGTPVSTATDTVFSFSGTGAHLLQLVALSSQPECEHDTFGLIVAVYCPVSADFSYPLTADSLLVLTDLSANADAVQWAIRDGAGGLLFSSTLLQDSFDASGQQYLQICLTASNAYCSDEKCVYIKLVADTVEICNNGLDDDGNGLTDLFDPDCPCNNAAYQAYCPVACEYVPDSFPIISMRVKWVSEIVMIYPTISPEIIVGDINN